MTNKNILVISPQEWGTMLLSKHHYALELARRGNNVFFLNPPDQTNNLSRNTIHVKTSGVHENLYLIDHRLFFPYWLKFRSFAIFQFLMKFQIRKILNALGSGLDIIWSFDIGNLYSLNNFPSSTFKIFHPVDEPLTIQSVKAAKGSGVILSVTKEILLKYGDYEQPKYFIHHGVKKEFLDLFKNQQYMPGHPLKVGYAGNLLRNDIDRHTLLKIIEQYPAYEFHFFGSYEIKTTNIGGTDDAESRQFLSKLKSLLNVRLHGVLSQEELAQAFLRIDAFLVCYDIIRDQSKGTNYHKLMEYLATGRVIISNNITTYARMPELIQMISTRENNNALPDLFGSIMKNLVQHNRYSLMEFRKSFAASNSYGCHIDRIEELIEPLLESSTTYNKSNLGLKALQNQL